MGRKKPFIAPGEGVKFYLVNRSQKDPMYLDESVGENVLVPADDNDNDDLIKQINGLHLKPKLSQSEKEALKEKRIKEQQKFGVYYEDDYNYLQHLKEPKDLAEEGNNEETMIRVNNVLIKDEEAEEKVKNKQKLRLPASVFASQFEEDVGYFNQAAPNSDPKIGWDPEILEMLDEDAAVDFEDADNFLDDDFFVKANAADTGKDKTKNLKNKSLNVDEDDDEEYGSDEDFDSDEAENDDFFDDYSESQSVRDFETKSRFSEYSMTSSVLKRSENLKNLDDHFEKLYAQYDDDQIGSLEMEEIDGYMQGNDAVLQSALEEFDLMMKPKLYVAPANPNPKRRKPKLSTLEEEGNEESDETDEEDEDTETESDDKTECGSDNEEDKLDTENDLAKKNYELVRFKAKKDKDDRFDCESILSTYSTLYNHPQTISEKKPVIELSKKSGLPLGVLTDKPITKKQMDKIEHKITRILPEVPDRKKDETKEEKKARKQMVKEHRRERRVEKKINKMAFKQEEKAQIQQMKQTANMVKLPL